VINSQNNTTLQPSSVFFFSHGYQGKFERQIRLLFKIAYHLSIEKEGERAATSGARRAQGELRGKMKARRQN